MHISADIHVPERFTAHRVERVEIAVNATAEHEITGGGIQNPAWGFSVLGVSLLLEAVVWYVAVKAFWATKGDRTIRTAFAEGRGDPPHEQK